MTFRIDGVLLAVFAVALVGGSGASARADTVTGDRAHAKRQPLASATVSRDAPQAQYHHYRWFLWEPYGWGKPPLQDKRDAYQGYFANPVDNPRYYGTGRATLIFR